MLEQQPRVDEAHEYWLRILAGVFIQALDFLDPVQQLGSWIGIRSGFKSVGPDRDKDNTDKTPLCIHRAPLGTHERFIGFLIEHYAGNFQLWLAPEQVRVLTISDDAPVVNFAKGVVNELRLNMVRCESDYTAENIKGKIQSAETDKVHTMLVIGPRDVAANAISVRVHGKGSLGAKPRAEVVADIVQAIRARRS